MLNNRRTRQSFLAKVGAGYWTNVGASQTADFLNNRKCGYNTAGLIARLNICKIVNFTRSQQAVRREQE
jgi:hypothetical protein